MFRFTLNCDANNLHCAPTDAVCSNQGTEQYFNQKEYRKCYTSFLRGHLDIGSQIEGIVSILVLI